ncbi:hypothetical protein F5X99DRAFT_383345 [Biscogniauxia marginata]|nr:hypothetical protein F5X99DRAFT_383345 [Biscogniauxia marginata]
MRSQLFTVALALAPHVLATAWPGWLPDIDSLVVRQDATTTAESTAQETGATSTQDASNTDDATTTADDTATATGGNEPETTNLNTGGRTTATNTRSGSTTGTGTKGTTKTTHKTFNAQDGAGGVAMITPATTDGTTLYRIDNTVPITWVWNYTSLQASPSAIDVMISCSTVSATWTLTQNMTFEPTATFTWDSNKFQESNIASPLVVEQYTLLIIDADSSVSATAEPGYLAPFDGFQFGMYTSRPYEDLGEWKCATCNAAAGDLDRTALKFAVTMSVITVLSFTWYVTGFAALL